MTGPEKSPAKSLPRVLAWTAMILLCPRGMPAASGDASAASLLKRLRQSGCEIYCTAPLSGAVYPARFPPPTFHWVKAITGGDLSHEAPSDLDWTPLQLRISAGGKVLHAEKFLVGLEQTWTPSRELWEGWAGKTLNVELSGSDARGIRHKALPVTIAIDTHSLPDDVFFRKIEMIEPPDQPRSMLLHFIWLDPISQESRNIMNLTARCIGCHSTGRKTNALWFVRVHERANESATPRRKFLIEYHPAERGAGERGNKHGLASGHVPQTVSRGGQNRVLRGLAAGQNVYPGRL